MKYCRIMNYAPNMSVIIQHLLCTLYPLQSETAAYAANLHCVWRAHKSVR